MDPNAALKQLLALANKRLNPDVGSVLTYRETILLCDAVIALDEWLGKGGFLPSRWKCDSKRPRFKHDCDCCKFLGKWEGFDLYACNLTSQFPNIIARYGDKDMEYGSLPAASISKSLDEKNLHSTYSPALRVGALIARDMGLIK